MPSPSRLCALHRSTATLGRRLLARPLCGRSLDSFGVAGAVQAVAPVWSGRFRYPQDPSHNLRLLSVAAVGGSLLIVDTCRRRSAATACSSTRRVFVGKAEDLEDGSSREVTLDAEDSTGKGHTLILQRQGKKFFATSPISSHFSAALRQDITTSVATYKVNVVDGDLYVEIPENSTRGAQKQGAALKPGDERVFALIGSGPASLSAAETLRQEGFGGRIVMITKEAHLPYDRTLLSKTLGASVDELALRTQDYFDELGIEMVKEAIVSKLDSKGQTVQYTVGGEKQVLNYDKVLVATGGSPRKLFVPGASMKGIFTLRTPEDAARIHEHAKAGSRLIVVGGSFIGMEIASMLKQKGCDVSVIAMETVPFERVLGRKVGAAFARLLQQEGVSWCGSAQVRLFRGTGHVNGVELEDGEVLPADFVVVGAGVLPNTRFVEGVPLDKNGAIIVGPLLNAQTAPTLFAAGDVCTYPAVRTGTHVRIEHWEVATQQGRAAAKNMLGKYTPFTATPFFWSNIFGKSLRFVGHAPDYLDRVIVEGDVANMEFISYYTENDRIWAVATVGRESVAAACGELMRMNKMPKVSEIIAGVVNADSILQRLHELGGVA